VTSASISIEQIQVMELKSHRQSFKKVLNQSYANKLRKQHQNNIEHDLQRNDVGYDLLKRAFDSQLDNYDVFEVEAKSQLCVAGEQIKECVTYLKLQCLLLSQLISNGVNIISTIEEDQEAQTEIETEKGLDDGEYSEEFQEVNREDEKEEEEIDESKLKIKQNNEEILSEFNKEKTGELEGEEDDYIFLPYGRDDSYVLI
jgi:hypothetical protein